MGVVSPTIGPSRIGEGKPPEFGGYASTRLDCYPDNGVVSSEMHVPVGREVLMNI